MSEHVMVLAGLVMEDQDAATCRHPWGKMEGKGEGGGSMHILTRWTCLWPGSAGPLPAHTADRQQ